jgi:hypothetical protein
VSAYDMLDHLAVLKGFAARGERRSTVALLPGQPVGRAQRSARRILGRRASGSGLRRRCSAARA